jgi:tRNA nucleotidyltransferase (CCA-adding enzyme)
MMNGMERTEQFDEVSENGFSGKFESNESIQIYMTGDELPTLITDTDPASEHYIPATEENPNRASDGTFASGGGDQTGSSLKDDVVGNDKKDKPTVSMTHNKGHKVKDKAVFKEYFDKQIKAVKPTESEAKKNNDVNDKVHDALKEYTKDDDSINFIETAGSFAKGTDLAGSSDLDIFVGFDYSTDVEDIHAKSIEFGEKVLKPLCDEGKYVLQTGADGKQYGEGYINGVEVQVIGVADVTLDQIKSGDMKTGTDRSPHHTAFMKKALYGKENETRVLKRFFKDAGVYGAESHNKGFSGYSTEVLMHNLGSFENVMSYFANFEKNAKLGKTNDEKKFDSHFVMADPIDPNRNLGAAFSSTDKEKSNIMPDKNLGRMIKTARHFLETGEMPEITSESLPSITLQFNINNATKESHNQLQSYASKISKMLGSEGYETIVDSDQMDADWSIDLPRINAILDEDTGKATINLALDKMEQDKEELVRGPPTKLKPEMIDKWKAQHDGAEIFEKDGFFYYKSEREFTEPFSHLKSLLDNQKQESKYAEDLKNGFTVHQTTSDYENLTDHPKKKDGESVDCGCDKKGFEKFVAYQLDCVKLKAKEGQDYGLLLDKPNIQGKQIKGTLAYAGVSLNNRLYLPEELAKGNGMTVPLILNHASTSGAENELDRLPQKFRQGLEDGLEMKLGEVTLTWDADKLTLFYEGVVDDKFFQQEIDDMDMAVSLGMYYDSDSPKVCDVECYTMIKGAEFHEVSLVYHPGFPIATIEANEADLKEKSSESIESVQDMAKDLLRAETKDLKDINWS